MELLPSVVALQQTILRRCAFLLPVCCLGRPLLLSKELWHISYILVHHGVYARVIYRHTQLEHLACFVPAERLASFLLTRC